MHERSSNVTLGYLLTLSRPRFWLYLAGPVLVGVAYGASAVSELFAPPAVALFAYFLRPANVYLYGVNDVFDADIDAENPKKTGEQAREARFRGGGTVAAVVAVCGLAGLALAGALVATASVGAAVWVLAFLLLGY